MSRSPTFPARAGINDPVFRSISMRSALANERSSSRLSISCIEKASSLRRMPRTAAPPRGCTVI